MYYSSSFVCSLVIVTNLYGIAFGGNPVSSQYRMQSYGNPQDEVVNIGNGIGRHNVVVLNQNPTGADSFARPDPEGLGNRFGLSPSIPSQPRSSNNGGHGYQNTNKPVANNVPRPQTNVPNTRNNAGTTFVSPSGNDLFHVGYGQGNQNRVFVNTRPAQNGPSPNNAGRTYPTPSANNGGRTYPAPSANNGGRTYQTQGSANINQIYVNGQPVQPNRNDGTWSTYITNGQTIHVLNSGSVQPVNRDAQLKTLYGMSAEIHKFKTQLAEEASKLNIKL